MSATITARAHLAELIELKEATAEMLVETGHAVRIRHAHICAANTRAELKHFTDDTVIKAVDTATIGTKPCK
jgi:hypothetical protein